MANPLPQLKEYGQSLWYDNIRRGLITSGELQRMLDEDGLAGVTSNPTIFEKAISGSTDYDAAIQELLSQGKDIEEIYLALVIKDIQLTVDILRPVYEASEGRDGFASLEVSPLLAYDTEASIAAARRLWKALDRPNVMIKIPGTTQGLPAIEQCLSEGININVTLLFGVDNYEQVARTYIGALEKAAASGRPIDRMASVASFFVSRVDTTVDKQLDALVRAARDGSEKEYLQTLLGKAGIANAKVAYQRYQEIFGGQRWQRLAEKGARVQRCLWASTSTKNPQYRDVMYAEGLIGADTVDTMPQTTMDAFREHGVAAATLEQEVEEAHDHLHRLAQAGIDFKAVTQKLQVDGVDLFSDSYRKLLDGLRAKRDAILAREGRRYFAALGDLRTRVEERLAALAKAEFTRRLWAKDGSLWKKDAAQQGRIRERLGWLTTSETMAEHADQLAAFAEEVKGAGFRQAVLLGMGGSSLAPEVLQRTFGAASGHPPVVVLDTTDPASILAVEGSLELPHTLFIVSSKSGTTLETLSLYKYFFERVGAVKGDGAGDNFVAITDPGTPLESIAREKGFRRCFLAAPDVGGRYSALTHFGLVPAAVIGVDVAKLLDRTEGLLQGCASCVPAEDNPAAWLGAVLGELAQAGRDKVTFIASPPIASFGAWVEQLLAESIGKEGKGLVPVEGEPIGEPAVYGDDRLFVYLRLDGADNGDIDERVRALEGAGQPLVRLRLADSYDLGQEFFRWEMATAVAGAILGINPFDEPNVQESKDNTARLLRELAATGRLPEPRAVAQDDGLSLFCDEDTAAGLRRAGGDSSLASLLAAHLRSLKGGEYLALLAYLPRTAEHGRSLQGIRVRLRDALKVATSVGYGPRFLHSTGQLHKGGPNNGVFIQLSADDEQELPIPGEGYGFSTLKRAQALGDYQSLQAKGRRILRIHLGSDVAAGLNKLERLVGEAIG